MIGSHLVAHGAQDVFDNASNDIAMSWESSRILPQRTLDLVSVRQTFTFHEIGIRVSLRTLRSVRYDNTVVQEEHELNPCGSETLQNPDMKDWGATTFDGRPRNTSNSHRVRSLLPS